MKGREAGAILVLLLMVASLAANSAMAAGTLSTTIKPSDDAYVVADLNDKGTDRLGFRTLNTGSLPILKVWYAWNLTVVNKTGSVIGYVPVKIISVVYFKFNLSSIPDRSSITDATLRVYATNVNVTGISRLLVAYEVRSDSWSQETLDWYNAPSTNTNVNSTASFTRGQNQWYGIDLTKMAQNSTGHELSVAVTFLLLFQNTEEQIILNSTRASGAQPYLAVTYAETSPGRDLARFFTSTSGPYSIGGIPGGILLIIVIVVALPAYWYWRKRSSSQNPADQPPRPESLQPVHS